MDDAEAVGARWARGLRDAAEHAYARAHGAEPAPHVAGSRSRWRVAPRAAATAAVVVALIAAVAWWGLRPGAPAALPAPSLVSTAPPAVAPPTLLVHVSGAVTAPGLVELDTGARVVDAIDGAGGLTADADESSVNLARPVQDGEHIMVAGEGDVVSSDRIDLNRADAAELEKLPGVGPVLAARIVSDREVNGPFASVEDLGRVPGVGPAILAGLTDVAVVG